MRKLFGSGSLSAREPAAQSAAQSAAQAPLDFDLTAALIAQQMNALAQQANGFWPELAAMPTETTASELAGVASPESLAALIGGIDASATANAANAGSAAEALLGAMKADGS